MKKILKSVILSLGIVASSNIIAFAAQGSTVTGVSSKGTKYSGYVTGSKNSSNCYGSTTTTRNSGSENVKAYVEIVNSEGYIIGQGATGTGTTSAYSGTVTRSGGTNAYGSCGTATDTGSTYCRLY